MFPLLVGSNERHCCKVDDFIFDWIFFVGECPQAGFKQNKSDLGYQVLYDLIELLKGSQITKLVCPEDMVPK